jgi:hypothetical protein
VNEAAIDFDQDIVQGLGSAGFRKNHPPRAALYPLRGVKGAHEPVGHLQPDGDAPPIESSEVALFTADEDFFAPSISVLA